MADEKHPDAGEDAAQLRPVIEGLVKAIQMIASKVDEIEGRHGALERLVTDDLIGGIHTMYKTNRRNGRIESLKSRYGGDLNDHFEALKEFSPQGTDHWGALHDMTEGMEGEELDNHVKSLSEGLRGKFEKLRGGPKAVMKEGGEPPKELPPEESKKLAGAVGEVAKVAEEGAKKGNPVEEEEHAKKSKDELIAERLKSSKGFKLK